MDREFAPIIATSLDFYSIEDPAPVGGEPWKAADLQAEIGAYRDLSTSLALEDA